MAKEEIKKDVKEEKFSLSTKTRDNGYINNSPRENINIMIDFERDYDKKRKSRYASTGKMVNGEFISDNKDYIDGLTAREVYILATAKVIKLKKSQYHFYTDYLKTIKRIEIDD